MNREIVLGGGAAGIYPLSGDVTSQAGSPTVKVTGLQGVPIAANAPTNGALLQYVAASHQWQPQDESSGLNASISVNGLGVSDDYEISVNRTKPVLVNGA